MDTLCVLDEKMAWPVVIPANKDGEVNTRLVLVVFVACDSQRPSLLNPALLVLPFSTTWFDISS